MTWTTIPNTDVDQDSPITVNLMTALRDNVEAGLEGDAGAPIAQGAWHAIDKVSVGDGNDGLIYDNAVDGDVANVETAAFADGYEYRMIVASLGSSSGVGAKLELQVWKETDLAWTSAMTTPTGLVAAFDTISGTLYIHLPRLARSQTSGIAELTLADVPEVVGAGKGLGSVQKVGKFRLRWTAGNIDSGKIYMQRRRDYLTD